MVVYICVTGFDFGLMKKHEENAQKGDLFTSGAEEFEKVKTEDVCPNGKVYDLILPVLVLIVSAIGAMVYTGFLGGATRCGICFCRMRCGDQPDLCYYGYYFLYADSLSATKSSYI